MATLKDFFPDLYKRKNKEQLLLEYERYRLIPGTNSSYREDRMDTSSKTARHSHVYARPKGGGKELYAVNFSGSGHDGSRGKQIPRSHADYFRSKGYKIPVDNILEWMHMKNLDASQHQILLG